MGLIARQASRPEMDLRIDDLHGQYSGINFQFFDTNLLRLRMRQMAEYLDINIVVDTSKPIFASHSAICRMGDPVLIYQQPAEPQLTSSNHEVVAACRWSSHVRSGSKFAQTWISV